MTKQEIFEAINKATVFYLATVDGNEPRVRGMMLYRADESGLIFHTAKIKDVFRQISENNKAELCFNCNGLQIRIRGELELVEENPQKIWESNIFGKSLHELVNEGCGGLICFIL